jgi:type I restriction enzyme, R subunit
MPTSDTSEKAMESLIVAALTERSIEAVPEAGVVREPTVPYGGTGHIRGDPADYDRDQAVDLAKLLSFSNATQPTLVEQLALDADGPKRQQFLARQGEIAKRGVVDVLRKGIKHGPASVDLFYGTPSSGNAKAAERFAANLFSVTRQLRYSKDETQLALDRSKPTVGRAAGVGYLTRRLTPLSTPFRLALTYLCARLL